MGGWGIFSYSHELDQMDDGLGGARERSGEAVVHGEAPLLLVEDVGGGQDAEVLGGGTK